MTRRTRWGENQAAPTIIGHRGASSEAPENTIAAFDAAVDAAARESGPEAPAWIELDLQHTADGEVVVIHDDELDRTTSGQGAVSAHTLVEVRTLDAGSWRDAAFGDQRIPTLTELVEWTAANPTAHVLVEYKGAWSPQQITPTVARFEAAGVGERLVLQSFDPSTVRALQLRAGDYARGLLIDETAHYLDIEIAELLGVSAVNPHWRRALADPNLVRAVHERLGAQMAVWTPDEPADWDALAAAGVDAIITNRPRQAHRHLGSR
ncbi:glycerophosphodiester phosphodiesterase [Pseudoclavibacter sp. 13-3]|uniref:glycerophosphodiester phosphodiesterase n=1 Tax=Pseudoclavibacter sp. 13-3 TaxID=2901228 RepID=UPI001E624F25|nr:glycerophosphodiester phosphodiesterase family protein [Pseudoclavibacter sp. 13-3]MCD7101138.1 glycerophosphodiester phosphodiesterase [Pseudoclavibacter sp. 13-3]